MGLRRVVICLIGSVLVGFPIVPLASAEDLVLDEIAVRAKPGGALASAPSSFNPNGTWQLEYVDDARGRVFYRGEEKAKVGKSYKPSSYYDKDVIDIYKSIQSISISYDAESKIATVTGGPDGSREVEFDEDLIGVSQLGEDAEEVAAGCTLYIGVGEIFQFKDSNTLSNYARTSYAHFEAAEGQPDACAGYLTDLAEQLRSGTAPVRWTAINDSVSIDLSRITEVEEGGEFIFFDVGPG